MKILSINLALRDIEVQLMANNMTLQQFGLPQYVIDNNQLPNNNSNNNNINNNQFQIISDDNITDEILENRIAQLNNGQRAIFNDIMASINETTTNNTQKLFFIDAPGGTGKTFLITTIIYAIVLANQSYKAIAWTGIAASLLPKGTTVHSTFQLPIPLLPDSSSTIKPDTDRAKELKNAVAFIWDECSMIEKTALSIIDRLLRDLCNKNVPFGGKILILSGDFRQIPPVVPHATMEQIIHHSVITHSLWPLFKRYVLQEYMRVGHGQNLFAQYLLDVGNGKTNYPNLQDYIKVPKRLLFNNVNLNEGESIRHIIKWYFGNNILQNSNIDSKIILCPLNETCQLINNIIIDEFMSEELTQKTYI